MLQLVSNFGFYVLAVLGKGAWGSLTLPPFDLGFVALDAATEIDRLLMAAIAFENVSGGMGTAAFVALLMGLCNHRFTATHYALLSAFAAVGRIYVSPLSGVLSESIGWPGFFLFSVAMAVPGLVGGVVDAGEDPDAQFGGTVNEVVLRTAFLLALSNLFMTVAWYAHLKLLQRQALVDRRPGQLGLRLLRIPAAGAGQPRGLDRD